MFFWTSRMNFWQSCRRFLAQSLKVFFLKIKKKLIIFFQKNHPKCSTLVRRLQFWQLCGIFLPQSLKIFRSKPKWILLMFFWKKLLKMFLWTRREQHILSNCKYCARSGLLRTLGCQYFLEIFSYFSATVDGKYRSAAVLLVMDWHGSFVLSSVTSRVQNLCICIRWHWNYTNVRDKGVTIGL